MFTKTLLSSRRFVYSAAVAALLSACFFATSNPVVSNVATVAMTGTASTQIGLGGGDFVTVFNTPTATPGQAGTTTTVAEPSDAPPDNVSQDWATISVPLGDLSNGDGNDEIVVIPLRVRGNKAVDVRVAGQATATDIQYGTTSLASLPDFTMIHIGKNAAPTAAGVNADASGASYDTAWNTNTIVSGSTISSGPDLGANVTNSATVTSGSSLMAQFTTKPTLQGGFAGPLAATNYVSVTPTLAIPTGLGWSPTGAAPSFTITLRFGVFAP